MLKMDRVCDVAADCGTSERSEPVSLGTVLVAVKYVGGVFMAADSRTSGAVVVDAHSRKINRLAENIYVARSGAAAHSQFVIRTVQHYLRQHQIEVGGDLEKPAVKAAAALTRLIQYSNKGLLQTSQIVAGVDSYRGPQIFQLPIGGSVFECNIATAGSGSVAITALANQEYKPNMSKEEAKQLCIKLITHAIHNDASCGGMIRWVAIDESGVEEGYVKSTDVETEEEYLQARF